MKKYEDEEIKGRNKEEKIKIKQKQISLGSCYFRNKLYYLIIYLNFFVICRICFF